MEQIHFSTGKDNWTTPPRLFQVLDDVFGFTLDPASTHGNALCEKHYTRKENGLKRNWEGEHVFVNPPYSRKGGKNPGQEAWVEKCWLESRKPGTTVVALLPARTDTKAFHRFIKRKARVIFIEGRLKFGDGKNSAPFPSMVCIWDKDPEVRKIITEQDVQAGAR